MDLWKKILIITVGFFETLIFSGCIFGWANLLLTLQKTGVYSHLCLDSLAPDEINFKNFSVSLFKLRYNRAMCINLNNELALHNNLYIEEEEENFIRCPAQDSIFGLLIIVAGSAYGLPAIGIGFALDHLGLFVVRITASVLISLGFVFLSFASQANWTLWPALILISLGGNSLRLSNFQFSDLFPSHRSTIIFVYTSCYCISTTVFILFQYAYKFGITLKSTSLVFAFTAILLTFPSTFLMPFKKIEKTEESGSIQEINNSKNLLEEKAEEGLKASPLKLKSTLRTDGPPLKDSICTLSFHFHLFWHINLFVLRFYITTFNSWAFKTTDKPSQMAFYNEISALSQFFAPIFVPLMGYLTDLQIKHIDKYADEDKIDNLALKFRVPAYNLLIATLLCISVQICKLFVSQNAVIISSVLFAISNPFIFGSTFAYARIRFHPEHFNRINGIIMTIFATLALLQYPLYDWMHSSEDNYNLVQKILLGIQLLSLINSGHILIKRFARKFAKDQILYRN